MLIVALQDDVDNLYAIYLLQLLCRKHCGYKINNNSDEENSL